MSRGGRLEPDPAASAATPAAPAGPLARLFPAHLFADPRTATAAGTLVSAVGAHVGHVIAIVTGNIIGRVTKMLDIPIDETHVSSKHTKDVIEAVITGARRPVAPM